MRNWQNQLTFDPIASLLEKGNSAIRYFVERDLLNLEVNSIQNLWNLPEPTKILKKQLPDGSWPRTNKNQHPAVRHELVDTWRQVNLLVGKYGFSRDHQQLQKAIEFLFSYQTEEGDFRGILANQYATYYTGANYGYHSKPDMKMIHEFEKCFQWLLSMRQDDGGGRFL